MDSVRQAKCNTSVVRLALIESGAGDSEKPTTTECIFSRVAHMRVAKSMRPRSFAVSVQDCVNLDDTSFSEFHMVFRRTVAMLCGILVVVAIGFFAKSDGSGWGNWNEFGEVCGEVEDGFLSRREIVSTFRSSGIRMVVARRSRHCGTAALPTLELYNDNDDGGRHHRFVSCIVGERTIYSEGAALVDPVPTVTGGVEVARANVLCTVFAPTKAATSALATLVETALSSVKPET